MTDIDVNLVFDIWNVFKHELPEKFKTDIARELLLTLEDYEVITYNTMMDLKGLDENLRQAVQELYKEDDTDEEDEPAL